MAAAPMDMLRKCRDQFAGYAREHRAKEADASRSAEDRGAAGTKAETNERLVAEIDATLREWG